MLLDPAQLLAQFERFAAGADRDEQHARAAERPIATRLERLARAEQRLVDAYQAEVISLAELGERRRSLAGQRHALEQQLAASEKLRREQIKARAVLDDLAAFCDRIRGRLEETSFADKQILLQLVVERIIVHDEQPGDPPHHPAAQPTAWPRRSSRRSERSIAFGSCAGRGTARRARADR